MQRWLCRALLLLLSFCSGCVPLLAGNADSLRQAMASLPNDTASVAKLIQWSQQMRGEDLSAAKEFAKAAYEMADQLNSDKFMGEAKSCEGVVHSMQSDYNAALQCYLEAEVSFRKVHFEPGIAKCHLNMGAVYLSRLNYEIAKKHLLEAKEIIDRLNLERYKCTVNTNLAIILTEQGKYDEALNLHFTNLKLLENGDNLSQLSNTYTNIGFIYDKQARFEEAYDYFKRGYEKAMQAQDGRFYEGGYALQNMVTTLIKLHRLPEAQKNLEKLWPIARQSGSPLLIADTYHTSSDLYKELGNFKLALRDLEQYRAIKDSLVNEDQNAKMAAMQKEYDILKRDATIKTIEQESALLKAAQIEQEKDAQRQLTYILLLAFIGGLLIIALGILIFIMSSRNRALQALNANHQLIAAQNHEIELQNQALKLQNERLEDLNREKDGLVGIVAHDLKSPMNKALALSELLKLQGDLNADQLRSVEMMGRVASAGNDLIRDLLDLNAVEHPDAALHPEPMRLDALLHELEMGFSGEAQRKAIQMHFQADAALPSIVCDRKALVRVMDNLISNALKFSPKDKSIYVTATQEGARHIQLQVRDQGPGIGPADREKLFKKFQRLRALPTGGENSTGLGLAITQALVHKLGGQIWLESQPGQGAMFCVRLPLAPDSGLATAVQ